MKKQAWWEIEAQDGATTQTVLNKSLLESSVDKTIESIAYEMNGQVTKINFTDKTHIKLAVDRIVGNLIVGK